MRAAMDGDVAAERQLNVIERLLARSAHAAQPWVPGAR